MNPNEPLGNPNGFIRSSARQSDPADTSEQADDKLAPGTMVGTYQIVSFVGTGGMSTVYQARHIRTKKIVALKMMHRHLLEDASNQKRFEIEARTVKQLDHAHILTVHEWGEDRGQAYLIMDYLDGTSLSDVIAKEGPMPLDRATPIFIQAANALDHAHRKGVVHRDLKPSNIMLVKSPRFTDYVKLLDFGMAKFLPSEGTEQQYLTKTGEVFGSPLYMSPEQCMGKTLDERSDIYSMGCLMYEVLTGKPPLLGSNVWETFHKQVNDMPEPISSHTGSKDRMMLMDAIILKCMAKSPKDRYRYMSELEVALEDVAGQTRSGVLAQIRNDMLLHQAKKGAQKQSEGFPKLLTVALAALTLAVIGFGLYALKTSRSAETLPQIVGSPEDFWQKASLTGQHFFDDGEYQKAEELFAQSLKVLKPTHNLDSIIAAVYETLDTARIQGKDQAAKDYLNQLKSAQSDRAGQIKTAQGELSKRLDQSSTDEEVSAVCIEINERAPRDLRANCPDRDLLNKALEAQKKASPDNPAIFETMENLAAIDIKEGKSSEAKERIAAIIDDANQKDRNIPSRATQMFVNFFLKTGDLTMAKSLTDQMLKRVLASSESANLLPWCKRTQAAILIKQGDYPKAEKLLQVAKTAYENDKNAELDLATTYYLLAQCQSKGASASASPSSSSSSTASGSSSFSGDSEQKLLTEALTHAEACMATDNPEAADLVSDVLLRLGDLSVAAKSNTPKPETLYQRALFIAIRPAEQIGENVETALKQLSGLYTIEKRSPELERLANRILAADEQTGDYNAIANDYLSIGKLYQDQDPATAKLYFEKALTYRGVSDLDRCQVLGYLGNAYIKLGKQNVAEDLFAQGRKIIEQDQKQAAEKPDTVRLVLEPYAKLLDESNRVDQSKEVKHLLTELVK